MFGGVVGDSVLPAVPDDVEPGAGEDADGVGVVVSSGCGAVVEISGPGVGASAVAARDPGSGDHRLRILKDPSAVNLQGDESAALVEFLT
jgi:hypothetical protein